MRDNRLLATYLALLVPVYGLCTEPKPPPSVDPTPELLEFLGSWETADGEFVDPLDLDEMPAPEPVSKDDGQAID
jgi:hypothetical protein